MVTNRYRETNRRYEKDHAACFYQQRRLITATIQFFDLFSGIGGFREGLRRAGGFTCVGHCEVDTYADKNYRLLFDTEGEWYCSDARTIEPERMPDFDLLCAGFPCQAFSIAGKREGFADARGTLFFEIARLLKAKRPKYFILENVPGLLSHDKGRTFCTILSTLSQLGYHVEWKVFNSKDFGVPQARKRVYIVGYLDFRCAGKILPEPETNGAALIQIRAGSQGERVYSPKGLSCTHQREYKARLQTCKRRGQHRSGLCESQQQERKSRTPDRTYPDNRCSTGNAALCRSFTSAGGNGRMQKPEYQTMRCPQIQRRMFWCISRGWSKSSLNTSKRECPAERQTHEGTGRTNVHDYCNRSSWHLVSRKNTQAGSKRMSASAGIL